MTYRDKLAQIIEQRSEAESKIEKYRDAIYTISHEQSERDGRRAKLQKELTAAREAETRSAVDAVLDGTPVTCNADIARLAGEIVQIDEEDARASAVESEIRDRIAGERERLERGLHLDSAIGDVINNSEVTAALVKDTRNAWLQAIAGSRAIKYLIDRKLLDVPSVGTAAGTAPMTSVSLLAYLERSESARGHFPDREFAGIPLWSEAHQALMKNAYAPLPGETPTTVSKTKKSGSGRFG